MRRFQSFQISKISKLFSCSTLLSEPACCWATRATEDCSLLGSNAFDVVLVLARTPANTPLNTPLNTLANTLTNTPTNTPTNTHTNTNTNTPANTPENTPTNTSAAVSRTWVQTKQVALRHALADATMQRFLD